MMSYGAQKSITPSEQEALIAEHSELVKRIAYHLIARLPAQTEIEDLLQAGMMGLLEAARNYDASRGASFSTFAGFRIRGAMLDEVRRHDWTPRSVHRKQRDVSTAIRELEAATGRQPTSPEVAEHMGITLDEYHRILRDTAGCSLLSLSESQDEGRPARQLASDGSADPDSILSESQFRDEVIAAIERLPEKEQMVLSLYYERELNLKEIGAVLGVTESRVCQIHGQALARLRAHVQR